MDRPILVFDGDCGMCSTSARFIVRRLRPTPDAYDVEASQRLDLPALGLTQEQCDAALQWVEPDGTTASGHRAVAALLRRSRAAVRPVGRVITLPGVDPVAARVYTWVSEHRQHLPGGTPACALPTPPATP